MYTYIDFIPHSIHRLTLLDFVRLAMALPQHILATIKFPQRFDIIISYLIFKLNQNRYTKTCQMCCLAVILLAVIVKYLDFIAQLLCYTSPNEQQAEHFNLNLELQLEPCALHKIFVYQTEHDHYFAHSLNHLHSPLWENFILYQTYLLLTLYRQVVL